MFKRAVALHFFLFILSMSSAIAGSRGARVFNIRKEDSHIGFSVYKWMVIKEEGRFKNFEGTVRFDPEDPSSLEANITVDAASVDSRNENRDGALRSREFFHVERYPTLKFKSSTAQRVGKDSLLLTGDLTIRDVTKRIVIPVKVSGVSHAGGDIGDVAGFESTFTIDRSDFHVADGWNVIGKEVTIQLLIGASTSSPRANR